MTVNIEATVAEYCQIVNAFAKRGATAHFVVGSLELGLSFLSTLAPRRLGHGPPRHLSWCFDISIGLAVTLLIIVNIVEQFSYHHTRALCIYYFCVYNLGFGFGFAQ